MKTIFILKGLPASGKSTWAKNKITENKGSFKRINKDDLRAMLDDNNWSKSNESFVLKVRDSLIFEGLRDGKHIIIDDTNLHEKHEIRIRKIAKEYKNETGQIVAVKVKNFDVPLEECIRRDLVRPNSVGEKVIRKMYDEFIKASDKAFIAEQDTSLPSAIMCDLDGTLALMDRNPFDASRCEEDRLNEPIADIVKTFKAKGHAILLLSGRADTFKPQTINWLEINEIEYDVLLMRPHGDFRKDSILKQELFENNIKGKWHVDFVLDDRNQVVDMWRNIGLVCCQVAPGDF